MLLNKTTYSIRGAIFEVNKQLGPGLLETIYEAALIQELLSRGHVVESQIPINVKYKGKDLGLRYRLDLLVDKEVVVEIKSVEAVHPVHYKQLLTYLKLFDKRLGLLVNFNSENVAENINRVINGY